MTTTTMKTTVSGKTVSVEAKTTTRAIAKNDSVKAKKRRVVVAARDDDDDDDGLREESEDDGEEKKEEDPEEESANLENDEVALTRYPAHDKVKRIQNSLTSWYLANKRDLPWRASATTPYGVWISEIMAQQTQVATVAKYWTRWMERFPTVQALANATPDEVNESWAGLGYYTRAKNLHAGAREVVERFSGELPRTSRELLGIRGVGEYTAAAIASIAFGERVAAVDGNVLRVVSRLAAARVDIKQGRVKKAVAGYAASLVRDVEDPSSFNQAMMELGARVCTPRTPSCGQCPVREECLGWAAVSVTGGSAATSTSTSTGAEVASRFPAKPSAKKKPSPRVSVISIVVKRKSDGAVLATRRPAEGLLANTWELVGGERKKEDETPHELLRRRLRDTGFCETCLEEASRIAPEMRGEFSHVFSHRVHDVKWGVVEIELVGGGPRGTTLGACCAPSPPASTGAEAHVRGVKWIPADMLYKSGLTRASTKILELIKPPLKSFIERAKTHGAKSLLGPFESSDDRFDKCLASSLTIDKMEKEEVVARLKVTESMGNSYGSLHGGATATIVDVMGTLALVARDVDKAGVTVDLNVSYLAAAAIGETVICRGIVLKMGRTLGFTQISMEKESDGALVAIGRHTKAFPSGTGSKTTSTTTLGGGGA